MSLGPGAIDVLVAHQGPYGSSIGFRGDVHGSRRLSALMEQLRPRYYVAGHAHQAVGPLEYGPTTYVGLNGLVPSRRWEPESRGLAPGCLAVIDTDGDGLSVLSAGRLRDVPSPIDFEDWWAGSR